MSARSQFVGGPFTQPQAFEKLAAMIGHWTLRGFGCYIIERAGDPIGHVGPMAIEDTDPPEFTWTLWTSDAEGQGFATEAALRVKDHLFADLGWSEMIIRIQPENSDSRRIAERVGATLTSEAAPVWYPGSLTYRLYAEVPA